MARQVTDKDLVNKDIRLQKGDVDLILTTTSVELGITNNATLKPNFTTKDDQIDGYKKPIVVDGLRLQKNWRVRVKITSELEYDELEYLIDGAGTAGGLITFTYRGHNYETICTNLVLQHEPNDNMTKLEIDDEGLYSAELVLTEGLSVF